MISTSNGWSNRVSQVRNRRSLKKGIEWAFIRGSSVNRLEMTAKVEKNWNLKFKIKIWKWRLKNWRQYFRSPRRAVEDIFALEGSIDAPWKKESNEPSYEGLAPTV